MAGDAFGTERDDHVGTFLAQDRRRSARRARRTARRPLRHRDTAGTRAGPGTRPSAIHDRRSSSSRTAPRFARVARDGSEIMPPSPLVTWTSVNRKPGSSAWSATVPRAARTCRRRDGRRRRRGGGSPQPFPPSRRASRPTVRPGRDRTAFTAVSTPGMNDTCERESWRIVSVWPSPPRITSWCATRPGSRTEWTRMPVDVGASALPRRAPRERPAARTRLPRRRHPARGGHRGSRGRVRLVRVVELDDLDVRQVPDRLLGEPHQQHRADREVRGDEDTDVSLLGPRRVRLEPRRAADDVQAVSDAPRDVVGGRLGPRELDRDLRARPRSARRATRRASIPSTTWPAWDGSTAATSSRSASAFTARHTSRPMRPAAPTTPTRITP